MPRYEPMTAKLNRVIRESIIPAIKYNKDLDYKLVINSLSSLTGLPVHKTEEAINSFVVRGEIKEVRILTIPDEDLSDWLKNYIETEREEEKQKKEELTPEQFEERLGEILSRKIAPDTPPKKQTEPAVKERADE